MKELIKKAFNFDRRVETQVKKILLNNHFTPINETLGNDVFIAGYPKSGNTWMQNLVTCIILDSTSERVTPQLVSNFVPDEHHVNYYKRIFPIMVFKTHNLPNERYKKVIHLVRDGRDSIVSYYKMKVNKNENYKYSLNDLIIDGKDLFNVKWHIHTRMWNENPYNSEIIRIKYEDLLIKPLFCLKKICNFLDIKHNDERLIEIYNSNNIEVLRNKVSLYGWDYNDSFKNSKSESFFRKGVSGDYKNELDSNLEKYFIKESMNELKFYNYI